MRDYRKILAALEAKAADGATPGPEREALLAKIAEFRHAHPDAAQPEPTPPAAPPRSPWVWPSTTATSNGYGFSSGGNLSVVYIRFY